MTKRYTIHTDGGARGNPGPAAIGIVITTSQKTDIVEKEETVKKGRYIGSTTNNVAEYTALLEALELVKTGENNPKEAEVACLLDSELVVKQLMGLYKVKDVTLQGFWAKIKAVEKTFGKVTYTHVPRAQNKEADKIVNEVLDSMVNTFVNPQLT